jgi:hypothetical protein
MRVLLALALLSLAAAGSGTLTAGWSLASTRVANSGTMQASSSAQTCAITGNATSACTISSGGVTVSTWNTGGQYIQFCTSTTGYQAINVDVSVRIPASGGLAAAGRSSLVLVVVTAPDAAYTTSDAVNIGNVTAFAFMSFSLSMPSSANNLAVMCVRLINTNIEASAANYFYVRGFNIFGNNLFSRSFLDFFWAIPNPIFRYLSI